MSDESSAESRARSAQSAGLSAPKLGLVTARRIYADLLKDNVPAGTVIGSEPSLVERYEVSRGAFREAVRILEYHGVVRTERGQQGGLVVTTPSSEAASRAVSLYASSVKVRPDDVFQLRLAVETEVAALAVLASDSWPSSLAEVLGQVDSCYAIHRYIARRAGNRALEFLVEILINLAHDQITHETATEDHLDLIRTIESSSPEDARRAMQQHIVSSTLPMNRSNGQRRRTTRTVPQQDRPIESCG